MAGEWPDRCRCRICTLRRSATSGLSFGLPLVCPKCRPTAAYYGVLKIPGEKVAPSCPNCGTALVRGRSKRSDP